MTDDNERVHAAAELAAARLARATSEAYGVNLYAYARRTALQAGTRSKLEHVFNYTKVLGSFKLGQTLGGDLGSAAFRDLATTRESAVLIQNAILDFQRARSDLPWDLTPALVAGLVSQADVPLLVEYRNIYDAMVASPAFPAAARDVTCRTSPAHASVRKPREPDLSAYPEALFSVFDDSRTRIDGISDPGRSRPRHFVRLLLPRNSRTDPDGQAEYVDQLVAARRNAGDGTVGISTLLPAEKSPGRTREILATESAAMALYLHNETPGEDGLPPLNTLVVLDPPGPRAGFFNRSDTSADPREWLSDVIRRHTFPVDAVVVCGGTGDKKWRHWEWLLPRSLPFLDYRRVPVADLPLQEIEAQLLAARSAALNRPGVLARLIRQYHPHETPGRRSSRRPGGRWPR